MAEDIKIYSYRNEMILCEVRDSENQARNDTPIYQTSVTRYPDPSIYSTKKPNKNILSNSN